MGCLDSFKKVGMVGSMQPLDVADLLREAGLRVTRPRVAVLEALERSPHADTAEVIDAARAVVPEVSHQAVYDSLATLTEAGLVRRIQPHGHAARYERRVGDNHHHVVCRTCGSIADVDCATGEAPCLVPSQTHGFAIDEAEVIFWGTCPACEPRPRDSKTPAPS